MGWLITLGILTLLAVLPLGVSVKYDSDGAVLKVIIGPLKITLFPRPKKEKKPQKEKKKKEEPKTEPEKPVEPGTEPVPAAEKKPEEVKPGKAEAKDDTSSGKKEDAPAQKKSGGPITDFLPLVKTALEMLGAFRRRLRVNVLEVKVIMAGDDPCDLALNYGRAWAAIGNLQPQLEKIFVIQKRNIDVECDFTATQTLVIARLDLTITLGRILATVFVYGIRAVIQFLKINKKRKGGAAK